MRQIPPRFWARFAAKNPKFGYVTSAVAESVNNMYGFEARSMTITFFICAALEDMSRRHLKHQQEALAARTLEDPYVPKIMQTLNQAAEVGYTP
jgi:hypothetical protein